jgi:broad specificity phosphatase PhoE
MGTLYLVRHGQASFGADDYDQLSPLGQRQAVRLGEYFAGKGLRFDAVITGSLKRQIQTYAGIAQGMGLAVETAPGVPGASGAAGTPAIHPALNEYDSAAVIATVHPEPLHKPSSPEQYRHHFRVLREGLTAWMVGAVQPAGMPTYAAWRQGIVDTLDHVRQSGHERVLVVSSGGPISTAVGSVLGTSAETTIELNLRIRNSSVTEFAFTPKRHMLVTYNTLPHLDDAAYADWITYA